MNNFSSVVVLVTVHLVVAAVYFLRSSLPLFSVLPTLSLVRQSCNEAIKEAQPWK